MSHTCIWLGHVKTHGKGGMHKRWERGGERGERGEGCHRQKYLFGCNWVSIGWLFFAQLETHQFHIQQQQTTHYLICKSRMKAHCMDNFMSSTQHSWKHDRIIMWYFVIRPCDKCLWHHSIIVLDVNGFFKGYVHWIYAVIHFVHIYTHHMESPFKHTTHYKEAWERQLLHVNDEPFITWPLRLVLDTCPPTIGYTRHPIPISPPPRLSNKLEA